LALGDTAGLEKECDDSSTEAHSRIVRLMTEEAAIRFAERLAEGSADVLGDAFVAAILHGSLVLGDYTPGRSDIDVLVVAERELGDGQIDALTELAAAERPHAPARVDLRVVTRAVAAAPTPEPQMEIYVAADPNGGVEVETRQAERDLVIELSVCRAHGRSLIGPPPAELIGPVPDSWVDAVGDAQLADWQRLPYEQYWGALIALTACRVWRFAEERRYCSKAEAAAWALGRDPNLKAVHQALHRRHTDPDAEIEEGPLRDLLAAVRARVTRARDGANPST
jgi:predicted nucleotidyltransferase